MLVVPIPTDYYYRHPHLMALCPGPPLGISQYQKGKTNLDFTEARDSEWQWHRTDHMQICISLETDNHTSTPPLRFLQTVCPSCRPTNSIKALKAQLTTTSNKINTKTMQTSSSLSMIQAAWYSDVPFGTRFTILRLPFNSTATQTSHITQIRPGNRNL